MLLGIVALSLGWLALGVFLGYLFGGVARSGQAPRRDDDGMGEIFDRFDRIGKGLAECAADAERIGRNLDDLKRRVGGDTNTETNTNTDR